MADVRIVDEMRISTSIQLLDQAAADMQRAVVKTEQAYKYLQKFHTLTDDEQDNLIESFFTAKEKVTELTDLLEDISLWAFED